MPDAPLAAHSLAEAYLYILAVPCPACGRGALKHGQPDATGDPKTTYAVSIHATCGSCRTVTRLQFQLSTPPESISADRAAVVNPTDEPSRILDLGQWLTLFRMLTEAAGKESDRIEARRLALGASECLDEALKFYDDADNDLPPIEAFFGRESRDRFQAHPEQFSRQRLLHLRSKLPTPWPMRPGAGSEPRPEGRG